MAYIERILGIVSNDQSFNTESSHLRLTQDGHQIAFDGVRRSLNLGAKLGLFEKSGRSAYTLVASITALLDSNQPYWAIQTNDR